MGQKVGSLWSVSIGPSKKKWGSQTDLLFLQTTKSVQQTVVKEKK